MWFCVLVLLICLMTLNTVESLITTAVACEPSMLILECPVPMAILSANYGRLDKTTCPGAYLIGANELSLTTCRANTSLSVVASKCNGLTYCSVFASASVFGGDPCPYKMKYLTVTYDCPATSNITTSVACENSTLTLQCPTGFIDILSSNFGRLDNSTCPAGNAIGSYPLSNTSCTAATFPTFVNFACNGKSNCTVSANATTFGYDPCPGIAKYLSVTFSCTVVATKVACENQVLNLQCPAGVMVILDANYGRLDINTCALGYRTTSCFAPMSLPIVNYTCNGQQSCSVMASVATLGCGVDPCGGTAKYLTVTYYCQVGSTTTTSISTTTPTSTTTTTSRPSLCPTTTTSTTSSSTTTRTTTTPLATLSTTSTSTATPSITTSYTTTPTTTTSVTSSSTVSTDSTIYSTTTTQLPADISGSSAVSQTTTEWLGPTTVSWTQSHLNEANTLLGATIYTTMANLNQTASANKSSWIMWMLVGTVVATASLILFTCFCYIVTGHSRKRKRTGVSQTGQT